MERSRVAFSVKCVHRIYDMNGQKLDQVKEEKELGVLIDDELKVHKQTAAAIKTANSYIGCC